MKTRQLSLALPALALLLCGGCTDRNQVSELQSAVAKFEATQRDFRADRHRLLELERQVEDQRASSAAFGKLRFELESLKAAVNALAHLVQEHSGELREVRSGLDEARRERRARGLDVPSESNRLSSELSLVQLKMEALARSVDAIQDEQRRRRGY